MHYVATTLAAEEAFGFIEMESGFVVLLSVAALVAILIRRIRIPYTVALVLVGLVLSFFPAFVHVPISSSLILALLVPPLIFEATLQIRWDRLRQDLAPIVLLAVAGTMLSTVIVGGIVERLLGVPHAAAFAFGALISATDPVAVLAFFRRLGVHRRLAVLVEGESLFNDAIAIVVFNLALGAVGASTGLGAGDAAREFLTVAFGGLGVGIVLGYIVSHIVLRNIDDHLVETATTLALAFGSYVVAEQVHWSGILAVVAAGLFVGNIGLENTSPTTRVTLENFWQFMAFVTNSLVFLLIGMRIEIVRFAPYLLPVAVAVLAVLVSRAGVVYGLTWLHSTLGARHQVPVRYRCVMFWGGLRGAISLALALTLTDAVVGAGVAEELQYMTFGVVLFTLLVQGLSIEPVIRALGLSERSDYMLEQQRHQALIYASHAARRELDRLLDDGMLAGDVWRSMAEVCTEELESRTLALRGHLDEYQELESEMVLQARADVLRAERAAITDASRRGLISEEVHDELVRAIDERAAALAVIRRHHKLGSGEDPDGRHVGRDTAGD